MSRFFKVGSEIGVGRGHAVGELLGPARPDDGGRDRRLGQHPRDGERRHRETGLGGEGPERVDSVELASCQYRCWYMAPAVPTVNRVPSAGAAPRSCLPLRRPPASGL